MYFSVNTSYKKNMTAISNEMFVSNKTIILKGANDISFRYKPGSKNEKVVIPNYHVMVCDEKGSSIATEETSDKFMIHYKEDQIVCVSKMVIDTDGTTKWINIKGLFVGIWILKKKRKNKICFAWIHFDKEIAQYLEVKSYGVGAKVIMKIINFVFSALRQTYTSTAPASKVLQIPEVLFLESEDIDCV